MWRVVEMNEGLRNTNARNFQSKRRCQDPMARVAVYGPNVNSVTGDVRRPVTAAYGAVVRHASDAGSDHKRYAGKLPTSIKQFKRARLHGLEAESALTATAAELTRTEVLHHGRILLFLRRV